MKNIGLLLFIIFSLMGFIGGGTFIYEGSNIEKGTFTIDCYDRFSNKIIGETCINEVGTDVVVGYIFFGILIIISLNLLGYALYSELDRGTDCW